MDTTTVNVRKRLELHGRDEFELQQRLETFCEALRSRRGSILDIQVDGSCTSARRAAVLYRVPLQASEVSAVEPVTDM